MEKGRYRVSIVIPNYNGKEYLARLLPSLANQTFRDYEVIIIDDCSPDRTVLDYIRSFISNYQNMRLIENNQNLGFVKNCNKGITLATGDYICILTNDTELKSDFIKKNVEILDADRYIGVLSCIIVDEKGNNWFSGGFFRAGLSKNMVDDFQGVRTVDWVAGTACFYRRDVFDSAGLIDDGFFMYHEDIEFCLRVRSRTNYRICAFSDKLVTHYSGGSMGRRMSYYLTRNHILLARMYYPKYLPKVLTFRLIETVKSIGAAAKKPSPKYPIWSCLIAINAIRGAIDGLLEKRGK
ncbi:MAG: glycosyltransferase family 2 protein [Chloroflexi bacterium]|nr:glycosyltransferase family 2 protein [Chloroflexota bacterium]